MNAESAPKYTMRRPTLPGLGEGWYEFGRLLDDGLTRFAGVVGDSMPTRNNGKHGKPQRGEVVSLNRNSVRSRLGRLGWRTGSYYR